jgi:hypothetical protein
VVAVTLFGFDPLPSPTERSSACPGQSPCDRLPGPDSGANRDWSPTGGRPGPARAFLGADRAAVRGDLHPSGDTGRSPAPRPTPGPTPGRGRALRHFFLRHALGKARGGSGDFPVGRYHGRPPTGGRPGLVPRALLHCGPGTRWRPEYFRERCRSTRPLGRSRGRPPVVGARAALTAPDLGPDDGRPRAVSLATRTLDPRHGSGRGWAPGWPRGYPSPADPGHQTLTVPRLALSFSVADRPASQPTPDRGSDDSRLLLGEKPQVLP